MVQNTQIEKLENSAVKLTLTIGAADLRKEYDQLVAKYAKSAHIKGFRKGKAPIPVLERKFGESFRAEAIGDAVEAALRESFDTIDAKPLPYSQPEMVEQLAPDHALDQDLTFAVTFDVYPDFTVGPHDALTVKEAVIPITDEDLNRELSKLQEQNAIVVEKEDGAVALGNIVTLNYHEVDSTDQPIEGTAREDYTMTVGSAHNLYHIDEELVGMTKDETKIFTKEYAADFEHSELAGSTRRVAVTITQIKERDIPKLDDDFAQDVSDEYETLEDMKKDLRSRLEKSASAMVRNRSIEQIVEQLVAVTPIQLPQSMVAMELERAWQNLLQQYRTTDDQLQRILQLQGQSKAGITAQWQADAEARLKRSLIVQRLIETQQITVTDEDAEAEVRAQAEDRKADPARVLEYYRANQMFDYVKQEMAERRLFDALLATATITPGETVAFVDAAGRNE